MEHFPLVSVIIPCYNGEKFIDRSIESVFIQDYPSIELIVVDDGSTDDSKQHILSWQNRFLEKGMRFEYHFQDNRGLGGAISTGIEYVKGEYLTLLDADDRFLPFSIKKRAEFLIEHTEYSVVRTNGWRVSKNNRCLFVNAPEQEENDNIFDALVFGTVNNWAGAYMVRMSAIRSYYSSHVFYPSRFGQNLQLLLPAAKAGSCGFINEPLMEYILQDNSLSQSSGADKQLRAENAYKNYRGYHDIRLHLLEELISDEDERQQYILEIEKLLVGRLLVTANEYEDYSGMEQYYRVLKSKRWATLDLSIVYYSHFNPLFSIALRTWRKLQRTMFK